MVKTNIETNPLNEVEMEFLRPLMESPKRIKEDDPVYPSAMVEDLSKRGYVCKRDAIARFGVKTGDKLLALTEAGRLALHNLIESDF